jgi:hypothetical protein
MGRLRWNAAGPLGLAMVSNLVTHLPLFIIIVTSPPKITGQLALVRERKPRFDSTYSPLSRFDMHAIHLTNKPFPNKTSIKDQHAQKNARNHNNAAHSAQPNPHRRRHPQKRHRQKRRPALANAEERNGLLCPRDETRSQNLNLPINLRLRLNSNKTKRSPNGPQNLPLHPPQIPPPQRPHKHRHLLTTPLCPA